MKEMIDLQQKPENIIISKPEKLEALLKVFKEQGKDSIHVLADFDRTFTKAVVDGKKVPSVISILRDGRFLTPEYAQEAEALFAQYHPLEIDTSLNLAAKKPKMEEWWRRHFELLLKSGLSKKEISKVARDPRIQLRLGVKEFLSMLANKQIPVVIMSSAGLGVESIELILKREEIPLDNIRIISNEFIYDEKGKVKAIKEPIIHTLNKDETMVSEFPEINDLIKERRNVILLGDSVGDIGMVEGFTHENLIKIGFLNENAERNSEIYRKNFDVVITDDGNMDFVNKIIKEIL